MYIAYLCYPHKYDDDDDDDVEPQIKFEEPQSFLYAEIIPIQFSILKQYTGIHRKSYK
jgi:hypothetical protein